MKAIPYQIDSKHLLGTNNPIRKHPRNKKSPFASHSPLPFLLRSPWG